MPITIKKSQLMYRNESTGEYVSVDAVADKTSQQQINGINTAASNAIASINTAMQDIDTQPLTTLPKKAYKKDLVTNEETLASAATHAYAVGDYFFIADNNNDISLYKATAAIAVGNTISPGTGIDNNCIPAALADDVTSLSNDLDNKNIIDAYEMTADFELHPYKNNATIYNGVDIERRKNLFLINGTFTSTILRFAIFNDQASFISSTAPSYSNRPAWYSPITKFVIGHKYYFSIRLISGDVVLEEYTSGLDSYFDVRTQSSTLYQSKNSEWECTAIPEMICAALRKGTYTNAVFQFSIIDLTNYALYDRVENKIATLDESVTNIIDTMLSSTETPTDIDETLMPIRHAVKDSSSAKLKLFFFTDVHGDGSAIQKIIDYINAHESWIDEVINGGDTARYEFASAANSNYFDSDLAPIALTIMGNHDAAAYDSNNNITWWAKTQKECYDKYIAPYISGWNVIQPDNAATNGLNYYYKDYSLIRIIYLDAMFWDATQLSWLVDVLSSARSGAMSVMIVAHGTDGGVTGDINCHWTWYEAPNATGYYSNLRFDGGAASAVNDFITAGGEFICWLTGHTHLDRIGKMTAYPNQFVVNMNNSGTKTSDSRGAYYSGTMVIVDRVNKLIKLIRVGCNYDAYLNPKNTLCYNYQTQTLISQT